jgi:hypothetical protein
MIPACRVGYRPDGTIYAMPVLLQYSKPVTIIQALDRLRNQKMAFVTREDASAVLSALRERDADKTTISL